MRKKKTALCICVCVAMAAIAGCDAGGRGEVSISESSQVVNTPDVDPSSDVDSESTVETEDPQAANGSGTEPAPGTMRFHFTVSYLVEDAGEPDGFMEKSAIFSFDLPEEWTIEATPYQAMLYNNGGIIGQIELQPHSEEISPLFSDIDAIGADTFSTNELMIAGYPAKQYVLKSGAEGTAETKPSHSFYIAPDEVPDAYILIFFLPEAGTEEELGAIASSLIMILE